MAGMQYRRARRAIGTLKSAYSTDTVTAEKHVSKFSICRFAPEWVWADRKP